MTGYLIQAQGLTKTFHTRTGGRVQAVEGVDLCLPPGQIYGLVGSDGAGKTTLIRLLVGALKMDAGQVHIAGLNLRQQPDSARAHLGYLSQRFSLYEDLSVLENIRFFTEVRGLAKGDWLARCLQILEFVGLAEFKDRRAGQLSGGMKQKLGLASALVARPQVLLLDEPTTGVDPLTRQDFWQLIIRLVSDPANGGVCVLITTPYMDEASRCHRIGFMKAGRIIAEGTPAALRSNLNGRILELRGQPLLQLRRLAAADPDVADVRAFGDCLHLRLRQPETEPTIQRLQQALSVPGVRLDSLKPIQPLLEDVFMAFSDSGAQNA